MKSMTHLILLLTTIVIIFCYSLMGYAISQTTNLKIDAATEMYRMKAQHGSEKEEAETEKAKKIACEAFQEHLKSELKNNLSPVDTHLSDISNYSIVGSRMGEKGNYKIKFSPKPFQGGPIKGGSATYVIDRKTFKILQKEFSM